MRPSLAPALAPVTAPYVPLSANERSMLERLRRADMLTRADLSRGTGLTVQTAVRLIELLQERGMVRMGEALARGGRGKPGIAVSLDPAYGHTLGISIATDTLSLAVLDFTGRVLGMRTVTLSATTPVGLLAQLRQADATLLNELRLLSPARLGVGVAITGFFTAREGYVNPPEPLRALGELAIGPWLAEAFGQPVWLDNDGSMAAAGEAMLGAGRRYADFAYLHVSYGLGGGLVMDGKVVRGAHGNAGEYAGMLPALGMERATLELLRELLIEEGIVLNDLRTLLDAYDPAWPAIDRWIKRCSPGLSLIVSAITASCDPQAIVFGGRLPNDLAFRLIQAIRIDNQPRRGQARPVPRLLPAEAPADVCAIGAATLPLKERYFG